MCLHSHEINVSTWKKIHIWFLLHQLTTMKNDFLSGCEVNWDSGCEDMFIQSLPNLQFLTQHKLITSLVLGVSPVNLVIVETQNPSIPPNLSIGFNLSWFSMVFCCLICHPIDHYWFVIHQQFNQCWPQREVASNLTAVGTLTSQSTSWTNQIGLKWCCWQYQLSRKAWSVGWLFCHWNSHCYDCWVHAGQALGLRLTQTGMSLPKSQSQK